MGRDLGERRDGERIRCQRQLLQTAILEIGCKQLGADHQAGQQGHHPEDARGKRRQPGRVGPQPERKQGDDHEEK